MQDPGTLLVVEDDAGIRALLAAVAHRAGFHCNTVDSGETALAVLANSHPDVILLDLFMPDVNGFDVLRHLGQNAPHLLKHVIVITAAAARELNDFEELSRVWCVRRKPLDITDLVTEMLSCAEAGRSVTH